MRKAQTHAVSYQPMPHTPFKFDFSLITWYNFLTIQKGGTYGLKQTNSCKITIYDIAKASGFSASTVSLVLHNDSRVKESTKQKIQECMEQLNYTPSYLASSLASQRTNNIGLIIPDLRNPVFAEMIEGIESYLQNIDYHILIGDTEQNLEKEKYYLNFANTQKVDGLIVFPSFLEETRRELLQIAHSKFPLVVCGLPLEAQTNISYVTSNIAEGAYLATEALIKKGHTNICLVSGQSKPLQLNDRIEGYKNALNIYKIPFHSEYLLFSEPDLTSVAESCAEFLSAHSEVTAVFCAYDYIAPAVVKAIQRCGLRIPQDIALIGYDDIELNQYMPVELSSVYTNSFKLGETAARVIVNLLQDPNTEPQRIVLPPVLIERESSLP